MRDLAFHRAYIMHASWRLPWDETWIALQERSSKEDSARCCERIAGQIVDLARPLTAWVLGREVKTENFEFENYLHRLWICVDYHWRRQAQEKPIRFADLVDRLNLRGNLRGSVKDHMAAEVILAQALQMSENRAAAIFEADYMPSVRAIARRVGGERAVDAVDNFAAELVLPRQDRPPRLATFQGRTTLSHWLVPVVANYWVTSLRRQRTVSLELVREPAVREDAAGTAAEEGCESLLRPIFARTVQALEPEDRLILQMLVLDGVPQKVLARSLGLHSGTLTRRRQRAAEVLFQRVRQLTAECSNPRQAADCLELILAGDDPELRGRLAEVLAGGVRQNLPV